MGIPGEGDIGTHPIKIFSRSKLEKEYELVVKEDNRNPCGDEDTYWVEALYLKDGPIVDRLNAALDVAEGLSVDTDELKVYSYNYSRQIRKVEAIGGDEVAAFSVLYKVACGDDLDTAASEMDAFLTAMDNYEYDYIVLTKGRVVPGVESSTGASKKLSTTTAEITTSRTTRKVDNPPVKLNSLSGFTCTRTLWLCVRDDILRPNVLNNSGRMPIIDMTSSPELMVRFRLAAEQPKKPTKIHSKHAHKGYRL
ncbi:unnamed protein product [Nippostrongylus brasiliensis]|uniref:Pyruvate kinase n=1 Tax=Nippostrongylus brasiliensis TaxID=27835 RepID=A0A0N4XHV7_NIPBR|nr:unnamed protein product [Nippostrongylus brasiliensis]